MIKDIFSDKVTNGTFIKCNNFNERLYVLAALKHNFNIELHEDFRVSSHKDHLYLYVTKKDDIHPSRIHIYSEETVIQHKWDKRTDLYYHITYEQFRSSGYSIEDIENNLDKIALKLKNETH